MGGVEPLPVRRELLVDERGVGLRLTWHPDRDLVVLSIWHDNTCAGSFRLPVREAPRVSQFLAAVLGDWADGVARGPRQHPHAKAAGGTGEPPDC